MVLLSIRTICKITVQQESSPSEKRNPKNKTKKKNNKKQNKNYSIKIN